MNDNTVTTEEGVAMIAAVLDDQPVPEVTPSLRAVLERLGATTRADTSTSETICEWTVRASDGIVVLEWRVGPEFALESFVRAERRGWVAE